MSLILIGGKLYTLGGKLIGIGTGAQSSPPAATTFAIGLSSASGVVGSTTTMTVTPGSGGWPAGVALMPTATLAGSFAPPGPVSPTGTTAATFVFTSASPNGVGTLNAMASGMTSGGGQTYTSTAASSGPNGGGSSSSGTASAKLSNITWTQPYPIHPACPDASPVGYFDPVDGIGPFAFTFTVKDANNNNTSGTYQFRGDDRFVVAIFGNSPGAVAETITVTCVDGRGDTFTKTFPIVKSAASSETITINTRNPEHNCFSSAFYNDKYLRASAAGGTHGSNDQITFTGPNGGALDPLFLPDSGILIRYTSAPPKAGSYPLEVHALDSSGNDPLKLSYTRVFVDYTPTSYIEFKPRLVSTSMTAGSVVGRCAATTPNNRPTWAISDSTNTFKISALGDIVVANSPSAPGNYTFSVTVTDDLSSFTTSFTIPVVQGTTLAPSAMSFQLNTALDNGINSIGQQIMTAAPTVTGITGTPQWTLVQENFSSAALANGTLKYLFAINPSTGAVTVNALLMAKTHNLIISCTDGVNTCTKSFTLPVAWAPTTRTVYIGAGMVSAHGSDGFEKMGDCWPQLNVGPRATTTQVYVYAQTDPDYYAEDNGVQTGDRNGEAGYALCGPIIISGVAANGVQQPRIGGYTTKWSGTGGNARYAKGFMVMGDGDCIVENLEFSHCFGSDQSHGIEAIRKDGETYGNFTLRYNSIHDADNGIETGFGASDIICYGNEIKGCGTSHVSAGACHNFYIGGQWSAIIHDNYSVMAMTGHDFKCRATRGTVYNNRFLDLSRGGASCNMDLPNGGNYEVYGNTFQKGTMAANPFSVQYAAEFDVTNPDYTKNLLNFHDNTTTVLTLDGSHYGTPAAVQHWVYKDYYGITTHVDTANNKYWPAESAHFTFLHEYDYTNNNSQTTSPTAKTTATGNTPIAVCPAIDFTRPYLQGTMPRFGWYRTVNQYGDSLAEYDNNQIDPGLDDMFVASSAAAGTLISTMAAHAAMDDYGGTPNQPFVAGTAWALSNDQVYYSQPYPNTPWSNGLFTLSAQSDGTAKFAVGSASIAPGVYWVQPVATALNGTIVKNRFAVRVV